MFGIFILTLAIFGAVVQAAAPEDSFEGVLDLTAKNFDEHVNGKKLALVEFYAPWCGHCKSIAGAMKTLGAASNKELKGKVVIAKVNADKENSVGQRFGIQGFPTIKIFKRGKPVSSPEDYQQGRDAESMISYLQDVLKEDSSFGRVEVLDPIAAKYKDASDLNDLLKELQGKAEGVEEDDKELAAYYVSYVEKAISKGKEYLSKEHTRLSNMVTTARLTSEKQDQLNQKIAVLSAFVGEEED